MSRNYQREDWRRQQPSWQEENQWSHSRSDDDFSMGLGQESRGARGQDYRGRESGWFGNEGWQNTSRWQRSQQRGGYETQDTMRRNEGQFVGRGPRGYKRSDGRIEEDINERLTQHGTIDATDVEVSVQNAEVTLRGTVDSRQAKRLAEDIADSVSGVKDVVNQIKIKQQGTETAGKQRKAS
jgi:osmotically-inducible protein OsmY